MGKTDQHEGGGTLQDKLRLLLPHWIEHNDEHAADFRNWAEKARAAGEQEVAEEIATAAKELGWVNEALGAALEKLDEPA
jgi:hypothetical protein